MDADRFSLKARRTTRIPLRIPILIVIEEGDKTRTLDAWTMIVNVHGAKIECKHPLPLHQEITIQVPFNGMSQKGKVVWNRSEPNDSDAYEIGVELDRPENLWGVGFPPSDWSAGRATKATEGTAAILDLSLTGASGQRHGESDAVSAQAERNGIKGASEDCLETDKSLGPEQLVQMLDLSAEISSPNPEESTAAPQGSIATFSEVQLQPPEEEGSMPDAEIRVEAQPEQAMSAPGLYRDAEEPNLGETYRDPRAASGPSTAAGAAGQFNPTDKLSAFFSELVNSALQTRLLGLIEGVEKRIQNRVAEIESTTVSRIEEQIRSAAKDQSFSVQQRAREFVEAQQQALEQNVQRCVAEAEGATRQWQQEQLDKGKQAMNAEMAGLLLTSKQQLEQHSGELVSTTQQGLRASMEQELPGIEKDLLDRCRIQGERMMAAQVEQWMLLFSDRVQNAQQSMQQRLDETLQEVSTRQAATMEARFDELQAQACTGLEEQLHRIGTQIRQAFLRHMITELGRSQQVWLQQAQRQLDKMASENLDRSRRNLAECMKSFGEFLIQQAATTKEERAAGVPDSQAQLPLEETFSEAPSKTHP